MRDHAAWIVRRGDVGAAFAWLIFTVLAAIISITGDRQLIPWCTALVGVASVVTLATYLGRRFERLETDAFERGLNAGRAGVIELPERDPRY